MISVHQHKLSAFTLSFLSFFLSFLRTLVTAKAVMLPTAVTTSSSLANQGDLLSMEGKRVSGLWCVTTGGQSTSWQKKFVCVFSTGGLPPSWFIIVCLCVFPLGVNPPAGKKRIVCVFSTGGLPPSWFNHVCLSTGGIPWIGGA